MSGDHLKRKKMYIMSSQQQIYSHGEGLHIKITGTMETTIVKFRDEFYIPSIKKIHFVFIMYGPWVHITV